MLLLRSLSCTHGQLCREDCGQLASFVSARFPGALFSYQVAKGNRFFKVNCLGPLKPLPDTQQVEQSLHYIPSLFIVTVQVILVACQCHRAPQVPEGLWCVSHRDNPSCSMPQQLVAPEPPLHNCLPKLV